MEKFIRPRQPLWFKPNLNWEQYMRKKDMRDKIRTELLIMTNNHCSYTDKIIDKDIAEIDWFIPKSKSDKLEWENLYIVYLVTNRIKNRKYSELLIRPDSKDYEFEKYFKIDFERHLILVNRNASLENQERAKITIDYLGLNHQSIIEDRKQELIKYFQRVVEVVELKKIKSKEIKPEEHEEINLNNFSYRFYLKRALEKYRNEVSEYIDEIHIKKYFCIEDFKISELSDKKEIYILGENGDGKTIILQAIILALKALSSNYIYTYTNEYSGKFEIELKDNKNNKFKFNNYLSSIHKNVYAYGVSRLRKHSKEKDETGYSTLFNYDSYLTSPIDFFKDIEIAENRKTGKLQLKTVLEKFEQLLENKVKIQIDRKKNTYKFTEKETDLEFNQLSDGYRSILIWISDLLARLIDIQPEVTKFENYKGIVLVDEIGSFLHPKWEFKIVKKITGLFPKIQWIFTTHSPIIALGASKNAVFYKIYKETGITKVSQAFNAETFSRQTLNGLLTSPLFDLQSARPASYQEDKYDLQTGNFYYDIIRPVQSNKSILCDIKF